MAFPYSPVFTVIFQNCTSTLRHNSTQNEKSFCLQLYRSTDLTVLVLRALFSELSYTVQFCLLSGNPWIQRLISLFLLLGMVLI